MLIQNKRPQQGDIVAIKLVNGEEVIGKLVDVGDVAGVTLNKPIAVQLQMVAPGQAAIGFAPFMMARDEDGDFAFYGHSILVAPAKVREDIKANYLKATTGLEIPPNGAGTLLKP